MKNYFVEKSKVSALSARSNLLEKDFIQKNSMFQVLVQQMIVPELVSEVEFVQENNLLNIKLPFITTVTTYVI